MRAANYYRWVFNETNYPGSPTSAAPWQGQTIRSAALENETVQPAWGQMAS